MDSEVFRVGPFTITHECTGWVCPQCNRGINPDLAVCPYCPITLRWSDTTTLYPETTTGVHYEPDRSLIEP